MSSTVEVTAARRHSRARYLVLIPLLPALAALAFVATVPLSSVNSDLGAQAVPVVAEPAAAAVQAAPAITASPSPAAAEVQIFSAPPITVLPPPPPPPPPAVKKRSSGHGSSAGCSSGATYGSYECASFGYINGDRAAAGVPALTWSSSLANTARSWANYLADNSITGSDIHHSTIWKNGENIYWISGGSGDGLAARANTAFVGSPGHYANLVRGTFHSVGVGIAHGPGGWYVVQNFSN